MKVTVYKRAPKVPQRTYASMEEAITRAAAVASLLQQYGETMPFIKVPHGRIYLDPHGGVYPGSHAYPYESTPRPTLEDVARLIAMGEKRLQDAENTVRKVLQPYPEIVAESRLSTIGTWPEASLTQALAYVAERKLQELQRIFDNVVVPEGVQVSVTSTTEYADGVYLVLAPGAVTIQIFCRNARERIKFLLRYESYKKTIESVRRILK